MWINDTFLAGQYLKREEMANGLPTYVNPKLDRFLSSAGNGRWYITKEVDVRTGTAYANTSSPGDLPWEETAAWKHYTGGEWCLCSEASES